MEPFIMKHQRKSQRVAVYLPAVAIYEGQRIELRVENISCDGMYLFAPVFMKVRAVFNVLVTLPDSEEPVSMFVAACFAEQTLSGFGVGVFISGISTGARRRWEGYYEQRLRMQSRSISAASSLHLQRPRVLLYDHALPGPTVQCLTDRGLEVVVPVDETQGMQGRLAERVDLIIGELSGPRLAALNAWRQQRQQRPPVVLMTSRGAAQDFAVGMKLGADRVIVKPCSRDLLVEQVMQTLRSHMWDGGLGGGVDPNAVYRTEEALSQGSLRTKRTQPTQGGVGKTLLAAWRWMFGTEFASRRAAQGAS